MASISIDTCKPQAGDWRHFLQSLEACFVVTTGESATGTYWCGGQDAAEHSTIGQPSPQNKESPENIHRAEAEKPCIKREGDVLGAHGMLKDDLFVMTQFKQRLSKSSCNVSCISYVLFGVMISSDSVQVQLHGSVVVAPATLAHSSNRHLLSVS